jgi:hypothetical protein
MKQVRLVEMEDEIICVDFVVFLNIIKIIYKKKRRRVIKIKVLIIKR